MANVLRLARWAVLGASVTGCVTLATNGYAVGLGDLAGAVKPPVRQQRATEGEPKSETRALSAYKGPKRRIAVMDMEVKVVASTATDATTTGGMISTTTVSIPPPTDFGSGLSEMLTTALVDSGRFIVLERKALGDIMTEQQLQASPNVNPASAAGSGKLLGAQALIRGAVTEYTYKRSSSGGSASFLKGVSVGGSSAQAAVVLDVRLYDVATSQIIDSVKAEGRASSSAVALDIQRDDWKMATSGFAQTPLGHATRQAIDRAVEFIVKRMETIPWEGRIASVDADAAGNVSTIYINAGTNAGLKAGDRFSVLRPGRAIIDPETQVVIGRARDTIVGTCVIDSLTKDLSIATPTDGRGFQAGDVVRLTPTAGALPAAESAPTAPPTQ